MQAESDSDKPVIFSSATDASLQAADFSGITSLSIHAKSVSAIGLAALTRWPIVKLDISDGSDDGMHDNAFVPLGRMTQLRELDIVLGGSLTDATVAALAPLVNLERLCLRWLYKLTDESCRTIAGMELRDLVIDGSEYITDSGLGYIATMSTLRKLDLPGFSDISDVGLQDLALGRAPIERLSIGLLKNVTNAGIVSLGAMLSLRELHYVDMWNVSDDAFAHLKEMLPNLTVIDHSRGK